MDVRTLTLTLAMSATGCAGSMLPPALAEGPPPLAVPASPEARAQEAMDRIAADCADRRGCATYVQEDIYPPVEEPSVVRYFVTSQGQEVESLGFLLRFEPGARTLEIERGNTLAYRGDVDPGDVPP